MICYQCKFPAIEIVVELLKAKNERKCFFIYLCSLVDSGMQMLPVVPSHLEIHGR